MISKLGFGFLRLPKKNGEFDWDTVCQMVDVFMAGGGRFFDTCYTYLNGMSEYGIRKCYETCLRHGRSMIVMEPVKGDPHSPVCEAL